jgi:hypothetical protein
MELKVYWQRIRGHTLRETALLIKSKCLAHDHPVNTAYVLAAVCVSVDNERVEGIYKTTPKIPGAFLPYPEDVPQPISIEQ